MNVAHEKVARITGVTEQNGALTDFAASRQCQRPGGDLLRRRPIR